MIKSIKIKNYRGIKDLEIDNFKKYNFFIGDNGSKKTTVLESIGISLSVLNFTSPLTYMLNRQIKVKNENISSLFFNNFLKIFRNFFSVKIFKKNLIFFI